MVKKYYSNTTIEEYPQQVLNIIDSLKTYLGSVLYLEDTAADALDRFILADINEDASLREATKWFGTHQKYPFTAYSIGEQESLKEKFNSIAKTGAYYSSTYNCIIEAKSIKQMFPMFSFFNNPHDYDVAKKIIQKTFDSVVKLDVPITINETDTTFVAEVKLSDFSKGGLAFEILEYLTKNKIYNLNHFLDVYYHDYTISTNTYPVDNIQGTFYLPDEEDDSFNTVFGSGIAQATPILFSSSPADEAIDVPVENSIILTFNVSMDEKSVTDNLDIDPWISHDQTWDTDSKILLLNPYENMSSGITYTISISRDTDTNETARAWFNEEEIEEDISISFVTEG